MGDKKRIMQSLQEYFTHQHGFLPTEDQTFFLRAFHSFLMSNKPRCTLILNGYAGTGKTTLLSTCANYLKENKTQFVLMAPTGRAAKVLYSYSKQRAFTIHKIIYTLKKGANGGQFFALKQNTFKNTVFIIDESSMIGEDAVGFSNKSLLDDVMQFVFSGQGCRLVLVGDEAQLPPVGSNKSPALDKQYLQAEFDLVIAKVTLNEVVRQAKESGILLEATELRAAMQHEKPSIKMGLHTDVVYVSAFDFAEHYEDHLHQYGDDAVIYITRSNKQANRINQQIRNYIHGSESMIDGGDRMMIVKNNYHWTATEPNQDFIANGDFCEVKRVRNVDESFGFQFADASLYFEDYDLELDAKIWLDSILIDQASMPQAAGEKLWNLVDESLFDDFPGKIERRQKLKENEFIQAFQVKFGYAVTCHKSQGGQWPIVYIDIGFITEDMVDVGMLRWLYTALTRASEKVFLVNFPEQWLKENIAQ